MATKQITKGNPKNTEIRKKKLHVGDICDLKITALAPNNVGIDEFSYPFAIFVPNAKEGNIKAKILKKSVTAFKDSSYAVAQMVSTSDESNKTDSKAITAPVKPGDVLTVNITKKTQKGGGENSKGIFSLGINSKEFIRGLPSRVAIGEKSLRNKTEGFVPAKKFSSKIFPPGQKFLNF